MNRILLSLAAIALAAPAPAAPPPARTLEDAAAVLDELAAIPNKGIPAGVLADADGVAIIPRVVKAGFIVGGRGGHGVVLTRDAKGGWGDPTFVNLGGASFGFQAGVEATDLVLVFRGKKSLERILDGKGKVTLGADATVAAGPVGRQAEAGTDAGLRAEVLSYSRSRGLFAGVALDGAVIRPDAGTNAAYRQKPDAKLADAVMTRLATMSQPEARDGGGRVPPPAVVPDRR